MINAAMSAVMGASREKLEEIYPPLPKEVKAMGTTPKIPALESYNKAAAVPVFPPATQEKAAAVFGTSDQRQGAVGGFEPEDEEERVTNYLNSF